MPARTLKRLLRPVVVFVVLAGVFLFAWVQLASRRTELLRQQTRTTAEQAAIRLEEYLETRLALVEQIRREWLTVGFASREAFERRSLALQEQFTGYQAVSWIDPDGILRWVVPRGPNISAENKDLHDHPEAAETFIRAERTGTVQMTPALTLWQGGTGFAIDLPMVSGEAHQGYVNAVFRTRALIEDCLRPSLLERYSVIVSQQGTEVFHNDVERLQRCRALAASAELEILNQVWSISLAPAPDSLSRWERGIQAAVLVLGLAFAFGVAWLTALYAGRQEQLRRSEEKYRTLVEGSLDAIFISSPEGRFLEANQAAVRLFGAETREQLLATHIERELFVRPADRLALMGEISRAGFVRDYELELRRLDGSHITVLVSATGVTDHQGAIVAQRGILRDVTEQRQLEAQVMTMQKLESIGLLAGGIAHDFNNVLGGILGHASLLRLKASDPEINRHLDTIETSVKRGRALTGQLLAFARGGPQEKRTLDLNTAVEETVRILSRTIDRTVEIASHLQPGLPPVEVDPGQLHQVIMNLCLNAADAMADGGTMTIETTSVELGPGSAQISTDDALASPWVSLRVRDTGPGIDPAIRGKIFEPFFSTKEGEGGSGLGLAVVYGIVTAHGGKVRVETPPEGGSMFEVLLPASAGEVTFTPKGWRVPLRGDETLLVIDDDEAIVSMLGEGLEANGYRALIARDGHEGLEELDRRQGKVEMVILDLVMPKMSGAQVYERIRAIDPEIPVVISSGYSQDGRGRDLLQRGAADFIQKPYTIQELLATVRKVLDETPRRRSDPGA